MKKLSVKNKTIISICLFLLIFIGLILVATFCDYQISEILTKNALKDGDYIASDFFGVLFEAIGTSPIYILIGICCSVIFWWSLKSFKKKPFDIIIAVIVAIGGMVAWWFFIKDIITYLFEHAAAAEAGNLDAVEAAIYEFRHNSAVYGCEFFVAIIIDALTILSMKSIKKETLDKLFWWVIASIAACILANVIMAILKGPMGRMRYRAINSDEGQALINSGLLSSRFDDGIQGYTRWYRINGQPDDSIIEQMVAAYPGASDAFRSYPSGHTSAAGMTYAMILLPDVIDFKNKKRAKLICWLIPIAYTMTVAISRIVVGAHYMSDVTFGGTLSFASMIIMREIFICKGSHFFALFPKLKKSKTNENNAEENKGEDLAIEEATSNFDDTIEQDNLDTASEDTLQTN